MGDVYKETLVKFVKGIGSNVRIIKCDRETGESSDIWFEVLYQVQSNDDRYTEPWNLMGGSVGYKDSIFPTLQEALDFMDKGLEGEKVKPDIWLDMLAV